MYNCRTKNIFITLAELVTALISSLKMAKYLNIFDAFLNWAFFYIKLQIWAIMGSKILLFPKAKPGIWAIKYARWMVQKFGLQWLWIHKRPNQCISLVQKAHFTFAVNPTAQLYHPCLVSGNNLFVLKEKEKKK